MICLKKGSHRFKARPLNEPMWPFFFQETLYVITCVLFGPFPHPHYHQHHWPTRTRENFVPHHPAALERRVWTFGNNECFRSNLKEVIIIFGDISSILIGGYNRTFPCMEANYSYPIKNQRGAINTPSREYFCDELVLYGIRLLA